MVFKMSEWQGGGGKWYCACTDNLKNDSGVWYHPARILGITPAALIEMLVKMYNAEISYSEDFSFVCYRWEKQADMRKFKNKINAEARKKNYQS